MKTLGILLLALLSLEARAETWHTPPELAPLFQAAGLDGTLVVYDPAEQRFTGYNRPRAETRYVPASTFKIANALIGLSLGAVASVDQPLPYRGPEKPFMTEWVRDMGLREAMPLSNVPIFQELARRIGLDAMTRHLARLNYGNAATGDAVDQFWLSGPLQISAVEQTRFLADLARGSLPLPASAQAAVADILLQAATPHGSLHAKTGWQNAPGPGVGWWVGWVRQGDRVRSFALNLDLGGPEDAPKRQALGKAALRLLGFWGEAEDLGYPRRNTK